MIIYVRLPVWWNWQTHGTQNPAVAIPYRFDPDHRHQVYCNSVEHGVVFLYPAILSVLARESVAGYGKNKNLCFPCWLSPLYFFTSFCTKLKMFYMASLPM